MGQFQTAFMALRHMMNEVGVGQGKPRVTFTFQSREERDAFTRAVEDELRQAFPYTVFVEPGADALMLAGIAIDIQRDTTWKSSS